MNEKELKKLNRRQLLELLILQTERGDKLEARVEELEQALKDKRLLMSRAGSIAQASLQLSGTFEAAQAAADQYLESVRLLKEETAKQCREMLEETRRRCLQEAHNPELCWEEFSRQMHEKYRVLDELAGKEQENV